MVFSIFHPNAYNKSMPHAKKPSLFPECRALRFTLWQCPPFLFFVMGAFTILAMIATRIAAAPYREEVQISAVVVVTIVTLVIGNLIITGFNKIAEINRMKSEFIAVASHQLRSPLTIFKWNIDVLRHMSSQKITNQRAAGFVDTLADATEQMIQIVSTLLDVSRIEAGILALNTTPFSLNDLTVKIIAQFERYAHASNIHIRFAPNMAIPSAYGDVDRIAMVVQNLIDNSIRYTPGSGDVAISIKPQGSLLYWQIHDIGVGIPIAQRHHIFEKFFRAENVKTEQPHGSGVGLYIAKAIVEASGGSIGFMSRENEGTTFWFTIPAKKV